MELQKIIQEVSSMSENDKNHLLISIIGYSYDLKKEEKNIEPKIILDCFEEAIQ